MTTPTNASESANKPCDVCSRPIGNRVFTICDDCWPTHGPAASTPAAPQLLACCEHPKGHHGLPGANTTRGYCASCPDSRTWHDYVPAPQPGMVTEKCRACGKARGGECGACHCAPQPETEGMRAEAHRLLDAFMDAEAAESAWVVGRNGARFPNPSSRDLEDALAAEVLRVVEIERTAAKGGR